MRDVYPPPGEYAPQYPPDSGVQDSPSSVSIPMGLILIQKRISVNKVEIERGYSFEKDAFKKN